MVIFYERDSGRYSIGYWITDYDRPTKFIRVSSFDTYSEARDELHYLNGGNIK